MGWQKGKPRKQATTAVPPPETTVEPRAADPVFPHVATGADPHDKKLDYFQYDAEASGYEWEQVNPLSVPRKVLEKYPGMRPRWRAIDPKTGGLRNGDLYDGWQVFKDPSLGYRDGVKAGGDLILAMMPHERADQRNRKFQERSTERVREMQEQQIGAVDRANAELRAAGVDASATANITVGVTRTKDKATGATREFYRGYHPEQLKEMAAKAKENRGKDRAYSIPGTKAGGRVQR